MILKNIPSFKILCQEDKIQLLKKSYGAIKFLTHIPFFNLQEESCLLEHVEKEFIVFSRDYIIRTMGEEFYKRFLKFIISFNEDWIKDLTVLNLLSMIILFYPNRGELQQRDYIRLEFFRNSILLQKYLQSKYGSICEGRASYLKLLARIEELNYINEKCIELLFKLDPTVIGPLTKEIFNVPKND
ncbi:nuclear hormone receptor-like protein 1 [Sarcoptes scabiei]|uniref:Nuclear hormone receptor-like protein 1 n=1 Tax=Sarcoptes scabiei TaxID=52283 RepID=A0A131ZYJ1_SARSC|nr:nuclear hormone receptor-like protein 1 [Sarcoptes scabiei]